MMSLTNTALVDNQQDLGFVRPSPTLVTARGDEGSVELSFRASGGSVIELRAGDRVAEGSSAA